MRKSCFSYNCEKYSILDIINFLKEKGYNSEFIDERNKNGGVKFEVPNMNITINLPDLERLKDLKMWKAITPSSIWWEAVNDLYSAKVTAHDLGNPAEIKRTEESYQQWHKESKKLYDQLKKQFGIKVKLETPNDVEEAIKSGEYPMAIKDADYIESLTNQKQKSWWPF